MVLSTIYLGKCLVSLVFCNIDLNTAEIFTIKIMRSFLYLIGIIPLCSFMCSIKEAGFTYKSQNVKKIFAFYFRGDEFNDILDSAEDVGVSYFFVQHSHFTRVLLLNYTDRQNNSPK